MEGAGEMWVFDFHFGVVGVEELVLEIIVKFRSMKFRRSSVFSFFNTKLWCPWTCILIVHGQSRFWAATLNN